MSAPAAFGAEYFDGESSGRRLVEGIVEEGMLRIRGEAFVVEHALGEVRIHPPVGRAPLRVDLPGGGLLVIADREAAEAALPIPRATGLAHRLESHVGAVLVAIAGILASGWLGYHYGIPWAAREISARIPSAFESDLGDRGLAAVDRSMFKASALPPERQARLHELFEGVRAAARADGARLELREGRWVGANAFALPGGVVVVTDQLVELLDDDAIAAVLAHEVGHLHHRHTTRHILQDSLVALASMAVLGDASSAAQMVTTLPTALLHAGYSRDFEREADTHAYELLRKTGRSPKLLGDALAKLEENHRKPGEEGCIPEPDANPDPNSGETPYPPERRRPVDLGYLSTHPATEDRIRAAEEAAR